MQAAGFVLVGGESSRMGQNKARLRIGSELLVEKVAASVAEASDRVALVGKPECYADLGYECLADLRPGLGPMAGLETALASGRAELNLIVACDMPGLRTEWLKELLATAQRTGARCVVARDAGGTRHPLCAIYRSGCLPLVREALDAGRLRLLDLARTLNASEVQVDAVIGNLNTPEQLANWRARRPA
jgi:molybdopterin-guanine dinucleotide biosynthesis protein A